SGPGRKMFALPVMGIGEQLLDALPILDAEGAAAGEEILLPQHSGLGLLRQFLLHARHGAGDGPPLGDRGQPVDPHADQEQRERLAGMSLPPALNDDHEAIIAYSGAIVTRGIFPPRPWV